MVSLLQQKMQDPVQEVYLIGTTPPKAGTDCSALSTIADKLLSRLDPHEYDGLIVYDIQDESSRVSAPRPFPFQQTIDPRQYSQVLKNLSQTDVITYKSVAQRSADEFNDWLLETKEQYQLNNLVLVGSPSSNVQINLSLNDACLTLKNRQCGTLLGGVTIAERHLKKQNEHERLLQKSDQGCGFFISQAIYDCQATIDLLRCYAHACRRQQCQPNRVILTFAPCGSEKTLSFIDWLGISVPGSVKQRLLNTPDMLAESLAICHENLAAILRACADLDIPLGLNIESLTNRKLEIDASVALFRSMKTMMSIACAKKLHHQSQTLTNEPLLCAYSYAYPQTDSRGATAVLKLTG